MYLACALITRMDINFDTIFKLAMQKVKVHKGWRYAFISFITELCHLTGVPTDEVDYFPCIKAPLMLSLKLSSLSYLQAHYS